MSNKTAGQSQSPSDPGEAPAKKKAKRGRPARDPGGAPAKKFVGFKLTEAEHSTYVEFARERGMSVSDFARAAYEHFAAESDPAGWAIDMAVEAASGPVEVRELDNDIRAAFLADSPEGETPEQAEQRYQDWLRN